MAAAAVMGAPAPEMREAWVATKAGEAETCMICPWCSLFGTQMCREVKKRQSGLLFNIAFVNRYGPGKL
jgi:hypothetical protein